MYRPSHLESHLKASNWTSTIIEVTIRLIWFDSALCCRLPCSCTTNSHNRARRRPKRVCTFLKDHSEVKLKMSISHLSHVAFSSVSATSYLQELSMEMVHGSLNCSRELKSGRIGVDHRAEGEGLDRTKQKLGDIFALNWSLQYLIAAPGREENL